VAHYVACAIGATRVRLAAHAQRGGPRDRKGTAGRFDGDGDHVVPGPQTTKRPALGRLAFSDKVGIVVPRSWEKAVNGS
jgi:hypothetical protein